jgi:hypothetical protein
MIEDNMTHFPGEIKDQNLSYKLEYKEPNEASSVCEIVIQKLQYKINVSKLHHLQHR